MKKILVVEDEPMIAQYLAGFFTGSGFAVKTAQDARAAIDEFQNQRPDLVLLDLILGDEDGLELLEHFKKERPKVPVIIVTGVTGQPEAVAECSNRGADAYVTKDATADHLLTKVRQFLHEQ